MYKNTTLSAATASIRRPVRIWLLLGLVMVFMQVVIGGITRLTDSGLSITEWAVIQGTLPPMNVAEWEEAFQLYKSAAKKQYEALHADMSLSEFKVIFFWEYFHRLWARTMGVVFLVPFMYFLLKRWLPGWLLRRLGVVILLASMAAVFGWVMVASGLNKDNRTWVSAYKLTVHLGIATALFGYLYWTWLLSSQPLTSDGHLSKLRKLGRILACLLFIQIAFGGLMAGMRAGLIHPYFSVWVEGERFWQALTAGGSSPMGGQIIDYEANTGMKAIVQLLHRGTAWVLVLLVILFCVFVKKSKTSFRLRKATVVLAGMLAIQVFLGISTVIHSIGKTPIALGTIHQAVALLLLICVLNVNYQVKKEKNT